MSVREELREIFDADHLIGDPGLLEQVSRNSSFITAGVPECLVKPREVQEIQSLVRWANESRVPLTPVSSGGEHYRGASTPIFGGVVVDLSAMNRIIDIDRNYRVAMVEPGVTYSQLKPELENAGLRLPMPLLPRKSKSVIGSVLEREPIIIPKYHVDMSAPLLCAEVVFGSGELFRTGEAAGPGSLDEQRRAKRKQIWDSGPGQISFSRLLQAAQGSLGIVTWATLRCEVMPTLQDFLFISAYDVDAFSDFVYRIMRLKLGDEFLILNSMNFASIVNGGIDVDQLRRILPPWVLVLGVSGCEIMPEERIEYQKEDILNTARQFGLKPDSALAGIDAQKFFKLLEEPTESYWKTKVKGGCCDIMFLTTLDRVKSFVKLIYEECNEHAYDIRDLGIYVQPIQQGRSCHCEFNLIYDPDDVVEREKVEVLFNAASEKIMNSGAFFSRPYGRWARMAYNRDAASREAVKRLKGIFDPNDILNPGKLC